MADPLWFRHGSQAGRDLKLLKLVHIHTHWAKGIYWDVIEVLRNQEGYSWSSKESDLQMLCDMIGCRDVPRFFNWYKDAKAVDLFQEKDDMFTSRGLNRVLKTWEAAKKAGEISANKRQKLKISTEGQRNGQRIGNGSANRTATERQDKNRIDKSIVDSTLSDSIPIITSRKNADVRKQRPPRLKNPVPYWIELVDTWNTFYLRLKNTTPTYSGTDTKALKMLVGKIKGKALEKNHEWTLEYAVSCLNAFFELSAKDPWINDNFRLPIINQNFDKIYERKLNGKNYEGGHNKLSYAEKFNADRKRILEQIRSNESGT